MIRHLKNMKFHLIHIKKIFVVEMIPPKQANYKDIKKTIKYSEIRVHLNIVDAGYENTLYKLKNRYYHMDWTFKNMVIPDYYKK